MTDESPSPRSWPAPADRRLVDWVVRLFAVWTVVANVVVLRDGTFYQVMAAEALVLAGFMRILTTDFVARFENRLMNIHPSLLPMYPGLNTHQRALDNGDTHAGATVHYVNGELDGGPPVLQARVPIGADDTAKTLAARVLKVEHQIYPEAVNWHLTGKLSFKDGVLCKDDQPVPLSGCLWG